jgi:hypothetical protein
MRRTHPEHISSALPPIADFREPWRHFAFVPIGDLSRCSKRSKLTLVCDLPRRFQLLDELSEHHQRRTACRPRQARDRSRRLPKAALGQRCAAKLTAPECAAARQLLPASASVVIQLDQERKQLVRQILGRLILLAEHGADPLLNREVRRPHPRRRLRFRGIVTMMKAHGSSPPPPPCVGITT